MSDSIFRTQRGLARRAATQPTHKFGDLYPLLCRTTWLEQALLHVLANRGAKTAGVDGIRRADLVTPAQRAALVAELQHDLRAGTYQPAPVRRCWVPKAGKREKRPLGIPTLRDRVVQEGLRMLLDPIWESDFLDCSYGFRLGRRTMDAIAQCYARINRGGKFYWVIEGDIRKCFDRIHHQTLLRLLWQRLADHRLLHLVHAFLRAGVLDGGLFLETPEGTPQGGILSPLLANIYLHQLDRWWWDHFGCHTVYQRAMRRRQHLGNALLVRYADDFLILWNGPHQGALTLRDELETYLASELHLELSVDKTHVTHVTEGFDFLGFHLHYRTQDGGRPWLCVTPTDASLRRFKARVKALTGHYAVACPVDLRFKQLNWLIRGWGQYYRHCSFKQTAGRLDYWVNERVLIWLRHKHPKKGVRAILAQYKVREVRHGHNRWNFGVPTNQGQMIYIALLADIPLRQYRARRRTHPYLGETGPVPGGTAGETDKAMLGPASPANIDFEQVAWRETRQAVLARDGYRCTECGKQNLPLDIHHLVPRRKGGLDTLDNLVTLCWGCHARTPSYGKQPVGS